MKVTDEVMNFMFSFSSDGVDSKSWIGILYLEFMRDDWEERIDEILDGVQFFYCVQLVFLSL